MKTRQLLTAGLLAGLAEITLLAVFVFIDEPQRVGGPVPRLRAVDIAYIAVPLLLMTAAAVTPVRAYVKLRRERADV